MRLGLLLASFVGALAGSIAFDSVLSMSSTLSADQMTATFVVTAKAKAWFGFGISVDGTMTSNGKGSDIIVCSDNQVQRYWVDRYGPPTNGTVVPDSSCQQVDGWSTMNFTRSTGANSPTERAFNLQGNTTLIWAYNTDNTVLVEMHNFQGRAVYDIVGPPAPTPSGPIEGFVQLDSVLSMSTSLSADLKTLDVVLHSSAAGWFAVGVSPAGDMTNNGTGSDVIACDGGQVVRYYITKAAQPTNGTVVKGAQCGQAAGKSVMTFSRSTTATNPQERAINVTGGNTNFIWAYNKDTQTVTVAHDNQGCQPYNVVNPPAPAPSQSPSAAPTPQPTPEPTAAVPTPSGPVQAFIQFDPVLSMATTLSGDRQTVSFAVTSTHAGWFAVGVSPAGDMINGGNGSDVIGCDGGVVKRFSVTQRAPPVNGTIVPDAVCTQTEGKSVMTFVRRTDATTPLERPISVTDTTQFIWAYNNKTATLTQFHDGWGSAKFNVAIPATGAPTPAAPTPAAPTPAPAPTPAAAITGFIQFDPVLSMNTSLASDMNRINIVLHSTAPGWFAVGVSPAGDMINNGTGSDVIACDGGQVKRFSVTQRVPPTNGTLVPGAACTQADGNSMMTFTRQTNATTPLERPISITGSTQFIWAYNLKTPTVTEFHDGYGSASFNVVNPATGAPTPAAPTPAAPTPAAPTPAPAPTPNKPITGFVQLDSVLSMSTTLAADLKTVGFVLQSSAPGWFAVGVSPLGDMTNNQTGSDVIACDGGKVLRYWITQKATPTNGTVVPGSTCTQTANKSVMTFSRTTSVSDAHQWPISITGNTTFIWAYHLQTPTVTVHHNARGSVAYSVSNPPSPPAPTPSPPIEGFIQLDPVLSMATALEADLKTLHVVLKSTAVGWFGVGVSPAGDMTNNKTGSDVIACDGGQVKRYSVMVKAPPTNGTLVPGGTCTQADGNSVMKFARSTDATGPLELPISVTDNTEFIWAYQLKTPTVTERHNARGSVAYNVAKPQVPTTAPTTAPAPTPVSPTPSGMVFDNIMSATAQLSEDSKRVTFVVTAKALGWIALGVSVNGQMGEPDPKGSDVIACTGGAVERFYVTKHEQPKGGVAVEGATCSQNAGISTMTFTRDVAAGQNQQPISPNGDTTFIWAYSTSQTSFSDQGHTSQGAKVYNVATGSSGDIKLSATAVLWIHMLAMLVGWGALLPFGVTFARYMKMHPDQTLWFRVHRICQYIGWGLQLFGFIFAIIYVSSSAEGNEHFSGTYKYHKIIGLVAVIFGTLQPVNAYFRPHAHGNIDPTRGCDDARTCWERIHKSCGYIGIALGAFNVFTGVYVAFKKNFENSFVMLPLVVGSITIGSMLLFALYKQICGNGKEDPRAVVGPPDRHRKNSEMAGDLKAQLIADSH